MMAKQDLMPEIPSEDDLLAREEQCRKALKTVGKAIFMRLFVTAILVWAVVGTRMDAWVIGLMALVLLINLTGLLPLAGEWKKQRLTLKDILSQYE